MSDVSVLGAGLMGSALVRAFLRAGHKVTVWSRTAARTRALVEAGAASADRAADAFGASPLGIVCVRGAGTSTFFMADPGAKKALAGRTLLQLSTGTSREARETAAWARDAGCDYLDGRILAYPEGIGRDDTVVYLSGPGAVFERHRKLLSALGGQVTHVGEAIGLAAMLDAAHLITYFSHLVGFVYGILRCEKEGYPVESFVAQLTEGMPPWLVEVFERTARLIRESRYGDAEATVATMENALAVIVRDFRDSGLNDELPAVLHALFERAKRAGLGQEDTAALIKALRAGPS